MSLTSAKPPVQFFKPVNVSTTSGKSHPNVFKVTAAAPCVDPASSAGMARKNTGTTLYEVLNVMSTASQSEIKAAYRRLAKLYHPDSASLESDGGRDFIVIHEAYATLSDPASRARYDLSIVAAGATHFGYSASGAATSELRFSRRWETDQCW
ncbi:chaperone protein dnaJ 11, chloroplastic-like [Punica granatum]|uniref:Chaperone protein dnaJ 11, chloroplastic-like n=1 Tax=Punica granatum TaxID=22663 RepID=A0A6P8DR11_PUNGR|nr:chaperone protein dnaJ 11, chloroplastic-like [Punica granatum]